MRQGERIGPWTLVRPLHPSTEGPWWVVMDDHGQEAAALATADSEEVLPEASPGSDPERRMGRWHPTSVYPTGAGRLLVGPALDPRSPSELVGPEAPGIIAAIGAQLLQTTGRSGPAAADSFSTQRLVFDTDGNVLVAPHPIGPIRAESSLEQLGAFLYRLATGAEPAVNPGTGALPPPSALRADLPPALSSAIMTLISGHTERRNQALATLHDLATPLPDLRRLLPKHPSVESAGVSMPKTEVQYTTTPQSIPAQARVDQAAGTLLVVPPADRRALSPAQRSEIAGRLGIPLSALRPHLAASAPLPVGAQLARDHADATADRDPLPVQALPQPGFAAPVLAAGLSAVGLTVGAAGAVIAIGTLGLGIPVLGVGLMALAASGWLGARWWSNRDHHRRAATLWANLTQEAAFAQNHPLVGATRTRLAELRRALAQDHLPETAALDVRTGLDEVDADLDALALAWDNNPDSSNRARLREQQTRIDKGLVELRLMLTSAAAESTAGVGTAVDGLLRAARHAMDAIGDGTTANDDPAARARRAQAKKVTP